MNEALVTYPGLNDIIGFSYTRGHGISPGFATLVCTPQHGWPAKQGNIELAYGTWSMSLRDCVADNLSFSFDETGQLWRITVMDRRWKWRYGSINGRYNVRLPNGPVDKLDPRTEKTPRELLSLLLEAMGEVQSVIGWTPEVLRPTVHWEYSNPAQELANLCDQFGLSITLNDAGVVVIYPRGYADLYGRSRTVPPEIDLISDSGTYDPPELPDIIKFVCGPSRYQVDLPCDAVLDDIDGLVKPLAQVSYAPLEKDAQGNETGNKLDWSRADVVNFNNIKLFNPADPSGRDWNSYVSPRQLCRTGLYRKYRIRAEEKYSKGGKKGRHIEGYDKRVKDTRLLLPMGAELVEPVFEPTSGWFRPLNCIVWGIFAPGGGIKNNYELEEFRDLDEDSLELRDPKPPMVFQARNPTTGELIPNMEASVIPPEDYSVESDTGIITLSKMYWRAADSADQTARKLKPAILWARVTVCVADEKTLIPHHFEVEFKATDITGLENAQRLGTKEYIIRDDDIFLRVEPVYHQGKPHLSLESPRDNKDFIRRYARERVTAEMRKFQVLGARQLTYAGWVRAEMTGDLVQTTYSMGPQGATTTVALNRETAALVVPYSERRFLEKIRNEKLDRAMAAYNRLAFESGFAFSKASGMMRTGR